MNASVRYVLNILKVLAAIVIPMGIYVWLVTAVVPRFNVEHPGLNPIIVTLCITYGYEVMCRNDKDQYRDNSILRYSTKREKIKFIVLLTVILIILGLAMEVVRDPTALAVTGIGVVVIILVAGYLQKRKATVTPRK